MGRVCWDMGYLLLWAARNEEAIATGRRGLHALGDRVSADRCRLLTMAGLSHSFSCDYEAGDPLITQALTMAEELGDQHLLGEVLCYKAAHHWYYMQSREVAETGPRAAELLRSAGDLWQLSNALWYTQFGLDLLGRHGEAAEIGEELEPLAVRLGNLGALLVTRRLLGLRELALTGDIDRFEEFARADLELCRSADMPWVSNSYGYLSLAHFWRGRWQEALENAQEAARLEPPGILAGFDWARLFLCTAYIRGSDAALAMLDERRDNLPRRGRANTFGAWTMLEAVVEGLVAVGERDEAANLYPLVLEGMDTGTVWHSFLGSTHSVAGIAAAAGRQWEKAEEHFETALRQAHEVPAVLAQPETRRWYARMLIDRDSPGDRDKARQLLEEAIAMYRRIGMPKHVDVAEGMLGGL